MLEYATGIFLHMSNKEVWTDCDPMNCFSFVLIFNEGQIDIWRLEHGMRKAIPLKYSKHSRSNQKAHNDTKYS